MALHHPRTVRRSVKTGTPVVRASSILRENGTGSNLIAFKAAAPFPTLEDSDDAEAFEPSLFLFVHVGGAAIAD